MKLFSSFFSLFLLFLLALCLGILLALFLVEQSISAWLLMLLKSFREFVSTLSDDDLKVQLEHLRQQLEFLEEELDRVENRIEDMETEQKSVFLESIPQSPLPKSSLPVLESPGSIPRMTSRVTKLLK